MPKPADKTKEEREIEFIRSISAAVKMGTSLLHSHFVKVEVRPEDFDEGDDPAFMPAPFYAAKVQNCYNLGSPRFTYFRSF